MFEQKKPSITLATIAHDPEGWFTPFLDITTSPLDSLYDRKIVSYTEGSSSDTIKTAEETGWEVLTPINLPSSLNRMRVLKVAMSPEPDFIHIWDKDRLLHATINGYSDLEDMILSMQNFDVFIPGATVEAKATHQQSIIVWENVKSWYLGSLLNIEGDIYNRGNIAFSKRFADFVLQKELSDQFDTDGYFPAMAAVFASLHPDTSVIGYKEYPNATTYEDGTFDGLGSQISAQRKNNYGDFLRRTEHVLRILVSAQKIARQYGLEDPLTESFEDMLKRLNFS